MYNQTRFSLLNTFRLVPVEAQADTIGGDTFPLTFPFAFGGSISNGRYHSRNFDQALQHQTLHRGEDRDSVFLQLVERGDPFRFQLSTTAAQENITMRVIDCSGKTVLTIPTPVQRLVAGNVAEDGTQMGIFGFKMPSYVGITQDGQYYLVLTIAYDSENIADFISNPFLLQGYHEDTLLIEYRHRTNWLNTYFEQVPTLFALRVAGQIDSFQPATKSTTFEDQNQRLVQLRSTPYRRWVLRVGGNGIGISDSFLDQLNNVFTCSGIFIDSTQYLKDDGASWEKVAEPLTPVFGASINIREGQPEQVGNFTDGRVKVWDIPVTGYPYAIGQVNLFTAQGDTARLYRTNAILNSDTELAAFIAVLQSAVSDNGALGTISKIGSAIYYTNSTGIKYTGGSAKILPSYFSLGITTTTTNVTTGPTITGYGYMVDYGDGSEPFYFGGTGPGIQEPILVSHVYAAAGTRNMRVFHSGFEISEILYSSNAKPALSPLSSIVGTLPRLKKLELSYSRLTNFEVPLLLEPSQGTLTLLALNNSTNLATGVYTPNNTFKALKEWRFNQCKLDKSRVQNIITAAYNTASTYNVSGGYLSVQNQAFVITLDIPIQFQVQELRETYGWTVITD